MKKLAIKITASASVASVGGGVEGIADPGGSLDKRDAVEVGKEMTPPAYIGFVVVR